MKKSTLVTLIVSILLIVLGFVLVALGISSSYDSFEYRVGRAVYFQTSYVSYTLEGKLLTSFGQMSFILGIAGIFLFAFLAIKNPGERRAKANARLHDHSSDRTAGSGSTQAHRPQEEARAETVHSAAEAQAPAADSQNNDSDTAQ